MSQEKGQNKSILIYLLSLFFVCFHLYFVWSYSIIS